MFDYGKVDEAVKRTIDFVDPETIIMVNTDTPQHYTDNGMRIITILDFMSDKEWLKGLKNK